MWKQHDETRRTLPLRFTGREELINDHLRAVGEITELRFPNHEHARVAERVAVLKSEHCVFSERRIVHTEPRLLLSERVERAEALVRVLAIHHRVAMAEGAALDILAREAHRMTFFEERSVREKFRKRPVDLSRGNRARATFEQSRDGLVHGRVIRCLRESLRERVELLQCDARLHGFV